MNLQTTGGCRDGLHSDRPNENQGAESTLAFLQSLLELWLAENIGQANEHIHKEQFPIGNLSSSQTRLYPESRELAAPGK